MKTETLHIRVKPEERERLKTTAGTRRLSVWCRKVLLNELAGGASIAEELLALRRELSAIGNNLNQIARRRNTGEQVEIASRIPELDDIKARINRALRRVR
ncbi:plasmid mobilization relaxosome protein MobC [Gluconobacter sp. R75690]|uniref:plasmid mobilization protein n=1 Tax=unclassified Gluconobacter TaxID=2644261 RepID=UPI00188C6917|nr:MULTISPECIES: plasmid mobilization relaxosome protein MobC [unclassified Gluconobacter]MBF0851460.1 plasmid mobilization relaxosome protein MobC [Gluconobacter sp. R75690]MBF0880059.1 plasmid mobilization relaxosome protein MobC [Gluconobacter sp. R75828]